MDTEQAVRPAKPMAVPGAEISGKTASGAFVGGLRYAPCSGWSGRNVLGQRRPGLIFLGVEAKNPMELLAFLTYDWYDKNVFV